MVNYHHIKIPCCIDGRRKKHIMKVYVLYIS